MRVLHTVNLDLPGQDREFGERLFDLLSLFGSRQGDELQLDKSSPALLPNIAFRLKPVPEPRAQFVVGEEALEIDISNCTGLQKPSPHRYEPIELAELGKRLKPTDFVRVDHVGFNLPWFDGVHPTVLDMRERLAPHCAYYLFPTGEGWDFILPATEQEISARNEVDFSTQRRPKFEVVSFEKTSVPLIQIDCSVRLPYAHLCELFPEGIADGTVKNVWVYLTNPYGIDVCLVVGQHAEGDWSSFFEGHRHLSGDGH